MVDFVEFLISAYVIIVAFFFFVTYRLHKYNGFFIKIARKHCYNDFPCPLCNLIFLNIMVWYWIGNDSH